MLRFKWETAISERIGVYCELGIMIRKMSVFLSEFAKMSEWLSEIKALYNSE